MSKKRTSGERAPAEGSLLERIANRCDEVGPHWVWTGPTNSSGQPIIGWKWETYKVRRVLYAMYFGKAPADKNIHMKCNEARCIRPQHMELRDAGSDIDLSDLEMDETIPLSMSPRKAAARKK